MLADAETGLRVGLVLTAFGFGFRHGIDWDHLAAIGDITGSQTSRRRALRLATLYALGHGLVVLALGLAAILLSRRLPAGVDGVMQRIVGGTLLALGAYVLVGLARRGRDFRLRSRWMLVLAFGRVCIRRLRRPAGAVVVVVHDHEHDPVSDHHHHDEHLDRDAVVHEHHDHERSGASGAGLPIGSQAHVPTATAPVHRHVHRHVARMPDDPFVGYGTVTAFLVGMLHGVGAETPTQVMLFVSAAGAGGGAAGAALLVSFVAGLLSSNTVVALAAAFGFTSATRNFRVYATVSVVTAVCSLILGALFVAGSGAALPVISG